MDSTTQPAGRPPVAVVMANFNGRRFLERCLPGLLAQSYRPFEVILVDNGSDDDSRAWLAATYPQIRVICNQQNVGFARANNQGILATSAPYILTLNNDTEVAPGLIDALVRAAESSPAVGTCACHVVADDNRDVIDSAGIRVDWTGTAWNRGHGEPDHDAWHAAGEVWGATATAALYRRSMLEQIGLFDEDFFAYYEDVDLAWRARLAGWQCVYVPAAKVYHVHSGTLGVSSPAKQYLLSRNKIWTILKNYPAPKLWVLLPLIIAADQAALIYRLTRSLPTGLAALRARLDAWRALPCVLRKRWAIQRLATPQRSIWQRMYAWATGRPAHSAG